MDLGNFLHLFQGSNKKLLEGKIAEMESEAVDDPVAPYFGPNQPLPTQGAQPVQRGTGMGEGIPMPVQPNPSANEFANLTAQQPIQTLVPANQYDPNAPNQVPVTPNPNAQGLLQRAQLPMPTPVEEGIPLPQSPENEFDGMTVKPLTELQRAQQEATSARNQKVEKQSKWKDVLAYIVQGANAAFNPAPGQKIVGYGQVKKDNAIRAAEEKLRKVESETMRDVQLNNIKVKGLTDLTNAQTNQYRSQTDALKALNELEWFDPKDAAHRQLAIQARVNPDLVPKRDNRKRDRVKIAGEYWELDPSGAYVKSNLPTDPGETMAEYTIKGSDGAVKTFRISQRDAARFETDLKAADIQFERQKELIDRKGQQEVELAKLRNSFEQEEREYKAAQDAIKAATDETSKQAAEARAEASKRRIAEYEKELGRIEQNEALKFLSNP